MDKELATQLIGFVQMENEVRRGLLNKVASLEAQTSQLTKAAKAARPDLETLERTVDKLIQIDLVDAADRPEMLSKMASDPNFIVACLDKLAETESERLSAPAPLGRPAPKAETPKTSETASDRAWNDGVNSLRRYAG